MAALLAFGALNASEPNAQPTRTSEGERIYQAACATCHGADGAGEPGSRIFSIPMPDFTDCSYASREPDADFYAVTHEGGPVRAFSAIMPAHGEVLGEDGILAALAHLRTFCTDGRWPRGELNLPRPLFTEKAYPEDEAVVTFDAAANRDSNVVVELLYEKRFGPKSQVEVNLPFRARTQPPGGETSGGIGDVSVGAKHVITASLERGNIVSLGTEVSFPSGDSDDGLGKGTTVFEPYLAAGQIFADNGFVQAQILGEIPVDFGRVDPEIKGRAAVGWSFAEDRGFGRVWTPMLEFIGTGVLPEAGSNEFEADLVPQLQVTLSRRQHIMLNLGVRIPITDARERPTRVVFYLLWDWYDGGLFQGW